MRRGEIGFCFTVLFILALMFSPQQFGPIVPANGESTLGTGSPSVVAETPLYYGLGIEDNQLLRYDGYWFAFYFNGSSSVCNDGAILCKTSLDGETWSQPTIAVNDANVSGYFSVYQSNETVVIAYSSMPPDDSYYNCIVRTKRGTISSNNITWATSVVVLSGANIGYTIGNFWGDYAFGKHWLAVEYLVDGLYYCCNIYCTEDFLIWQFSKHWDTWAAGQCVFQVTLKFVQNSRLIALYGGRGSYEFNYMFFDGSTWSSETSTVGSGLPWGSYKAQCEVVVNGTLYMLYSIWDSKTSLKRAVYDGSWSFNDFLPGDHYWGGDSSAVFDMKTNVLYFFYVDADKNQIEAAYSTNYVDWYKSVKICESVFGSPRHTRSMRYCEGEPALLWMEGTSQPYKIRFAKVLLSIVPNIFPTIQEAINNASDGDTILVLNGTYYENVVVNKSVSIIGESRGTAIIDGNNSAKPVMWVKASNVSIAELCLRSASGGGQGILVQDSLNIVITHNLVYSTTFGVNVQGCSNTTISGNNLTNNYGHGLELDWSTDVDVLNNSVSENSNEGIYVYDCQNCSIEGNTVSGNDWSGVLIQSGSNNLLNY
ncbi:MAG TPA: NosD domain-containing protein, partial [Patescibacteria group bacterium]|nr:NosD domain-containing protein [Patescibacteria group bacterium]